MGHGVGAQLALLVAQCPALARQASLCLSETEPLDYKEFVRNFTSNPLTWLVSTATPPTEGCSELSLLRGLVSVSGLYNLSALPAAPAVLGRLLADALHNPSDRELRAYSPASHLTKTSLLNNVPLYIASSLMDYRELATMRDAFVAEYNRTVPQQNLILNVYLPKQVARDWGDAGQHFDLMWLFGDSTDDGGFASDLQSWLVNKT